MNPRNINDIVRTCYADTYKVAPKWFYLGSSSDVFNRMDQSELERNANLKQILIEEVDHDMCALIECIGILFLQKTLLSEGGRHKCTNKSPGFDSVSYSNKYQREGGIYMLSGEIAPKTLAVPETVEYTYLNLNGRLCSGSVTAVDLDSLKAYQEVTFKCDSCDKSYTADLFLKKTHFGYAHSFQLRMCCM